MFTAAQSVVCEVAKTDEGASSNSSNDDDLSNLAAKIVAFNGAKFSSSRSPKEVNCESEQFEQRLWTRCSTSKNPERGT